MLNSSLMRGLMRKVSMPYALLLNHEEDYNNGDNVPVWNDKTGNDAHAVQDTAANQPKWNTSQFSVGSVNFTATGQNMVIPASIRPADIFFPKGSIAIVFKVDGNGNNTQFGRLLSTVDPGELGFRLNTHWRNSQAFWFVHHFAHDTESVFTNKRIQFEYPSITSFGTRVLAIVSYESIVNDAPGQSPEAYFYGEGTVNGAASPTIAQLPVEGCYHGSDEAQDLVIGNSSLGTSTMQGAVSFIKIKKGSFFTAQEIEDLKTLAKNTYQVDIPD